MPARSATPCRVLIVDSDVRVRRALTELINATDGFTVTTAAAEQAGKAATDVAIVGLRCSGDREGLKRVRTLAERMPVVAVSTVGSVSTAASSAGATAFCEMDGNTDALIEALTHACAHPRHHPPTTK